jgi:hypothetical protein
MPTNDSSIALKELAMNNYVMETADRNTHLKIVVLALTLAVIVAWFGMTLH